MCQFPPQVEGWPSAEDGESSLYLGHSFPFPKPSSPRFESTTIYQRRLKDPEHVRRPRNAFIIFRCEYTQQYLANGGSERAPDVGNKSLSKRAGEAWRSAKPETRRYYKKLADEEGARHRIDHPGYRFRPRRQKSVGQAGGRRSPKRRASSPCSKGSAGRSSSVSSIECDQVSQNDPLQIQTITVPTSSSTLSRSYLSRQPTPDFFHGYESTTPTSPYSPLSPVDDILYMPRPTIASRRSDSLPSYSADDSQFYGYPKGSLASFSDDLSLFGQPLTVPAFAIPNPILSYNFPPLAAVASSLAGWNGTGQGQKEDMDSPTPKPTLRPDFVFTNPFASPALSDRNMGYVGMPFGLDFVSAQFDMDVYRMGLKEHDITPASNQ
ncbi:hypothetical protein BDM02DRAFT_3107285 [Thelephora ganbajun]|uniref:Uncharacterized protein n=1 Tax=Thelephora ganbajun TaxID=370292 RepID=A0ACB6ZXM3_THEGA|nr:hypothetical protein BDM02DRAFT_3107285 [Thelephora ganbajun]